MNRTAKAEEVEQQNAMLQDDKKQQAETCSKKVNNLLNKQFFSFY